MQELPIHFNFYPSQASTTSFEKDWNFFQQLIQREDVGFFDLATDKGPLVECQKVLSLVKAQKRPIKNFVHVGIGGSSLGAEMLIRALDKEHEVKFTFIDNIDPDYLFEQLQQINPSQALFYFVSKSGGTAETMAALAIISNWLQEKHKLGLEDLKNYFVVATDPHKSQLKDFASLYHLPTLSVPGNVGGRFSVLSSVGLFPALFANIDCQQLAKGAQQFKTALFESPLEKNPLLQCASYLFEQKQQGAQQTVLMPYSSKLRSLSSWFVQLWAESLGKKHSLKQEIIHQGLTPIASYGATDQHSQVQLFMEGPYDKVLLLLEVEHFEHDFELKNNFSMESLKKLSTFKLSQLMSAELHGTLKALELNKRPYIHLAIPGLDAYHLGAVILFFECLTVLMGHHLNLDPFDQPGVEAGKKFAFEWLEKLQR